jgi:hypothetical protein
LPVPTRNTPPSDDRYTQSYSRRAYFDKMADLSPLRFRNWRMAEPVRTWVSLAGSRPRFG